MAKATPDRKGFFVLRDDATGLFLTGQDLTPDSFEALGTATAVYRSTKSAEKAARDTSRLYKNRQVKWTEKLDKSDPGYEYTMRNFRRIFKGVTVVELNMKLGEDVSTIT